MKGAAGQDGGPENDRRNMLAGCPPPGAGSAIRKQPSATELATNIPGAEVYGGGSPGRYGPHCVPPAEVGRLGHVVPPPNKPHTRTSRTAVLAGPRFVPGYRCYSTGNREQITSPGTQTGQTGQTGWVNGGTR